MKGRDRLCRSNSFIWIPPLLPQLTVTTEKLWGKKYGTKQGLKNPQKLIAKSLEKKTWQNGNKILNQQIAKMKVVKVAKNWKVITMCLMIVTVIIGIMMKMIVMLMNKDNYK